jgi:hypothetical protein
VVGSSLLASLTAKIAIATAAATAAASGLAAAGALPAPVQQVAASVASSVGLDIPGGDAPAVTTTDHPDVTETEAPDVTETDHDGVTGTVKGDDHEGDVTGTVTPNHGACVSFAAQKAGSLGFEGSQKGAFVSMIAQDPTAVSVKIGEDSKPDAACQAAIDKAKAAVSAASPKKHGDEQGEDEQGNADHDDHAPTSTVTSGDDHHEGGVSGTVTTTAADSHPHHD